MVSFIITIVKLLVIILAVATIHEFGHFLASKLLKVGVDEFSIGFGPKIVQKKFRGTMYSLRWLPLGGYCAIEGEEETEENKDSESSYQRKNPLEKIIILSMGVIFNFILALVIFICVYLPGNVATTQIKSFTEDSVLLEAGLQEDDRIVSINGKEVELYSQISNFDLDSDVNDVEIEYERDGNIYYQVPQNIDGQRLFEYQPFYQHENQNIQLNQNVNLTQNDHNQNRIQENQQTNFDENSLPEDIDELTNEITNTQNRIEELKRKQNYLFRCHQLLQNPDQLEEELQKMEQIIVSLRDVQAMIDEKVKSLVSNINYELSQK